MDLKYTMKHIYNSIIILLLVLVSFSSVAQEVRFTASAPPVVEVGETFRLTYSLNVQTNDIRLPDLGDLQFVAGPGTSRSSSIQIINGQRTETQSITFTYTLRATQTGSFTIEPATANVGSDQYQSNSVEIVVVSDSQGRSSVPGQQVPGSASRPADINGEDLFVRIMFDKREVYQGEALVATIKLFSKLDITGIENVRFPSFSGFFQQDIDIPPLRSLDREVIDGVIYGTGLLRQVILFPQRSGELSIEPFEMDALVRQRTPRRGSMFDDFFGGIETRRIRVESPRQTVKVKPLPDGRPPGFNGAVGDFSLNVDYDPKELSANEAVNLKVTVNGRGNLQLLGKPEVEFPSGFEVYDPNVRNNIRNSDRGQEGSITWEYLVIPRSGGDFAISPVEFTYFNPLTSTYRTLNSEEISLLVNQGDGAGIGGFSGVAREDLRIVGSDIRFIKTSGAILTRIGADPFSAFRFYLWFIIPLVIFIVLIIIHRKTIRDKADISLVKTRRASRMVRRRLKNAGRLLKDNNHQQFFEEMLKAQWDYLSDKLLIPVSELNREKARAALLEKQVPDKETDRLIEIIDECEFARYAPRSQATGMSRIYEDTIQIITSVEQKIRQ
ncbi:MAG: BatD family protein [Bacteroidales bacterium]